VLLLEFNLPWLSGEAFCCLLPFVVWSALRALVAAQTLALGVMQLQHCISLLLFQRA
jgi:hypothetical protein